MGTVNRVILVGNLGRDAELRYTGGGTPVANFSLATTDIWKDKSGTRQERTEWHNIVAWTRLADLSKRFLTKGRQVYVEGRLRTREWTDRDGNKRRTTEIIASQMVLLGSRADGDCDPIHVKTAQRLIGHVGDQRDAAPRQHLFERAETLCLSGGEYHRTAPAPYLAHRIIPLHRADQDAVDPRLL